MSQEMLYFYIFYLISVYFVKLSLVIEIMIRRQRPKIYIKLIEIALLLLLLAGSTVANVSPFDYSTVKLVMKDRIATIFMLTSKQESINKENSWKQQMVLSFHKAAQDYYAQFPHHSPDSSGKNLQPILFVISDPNDGLFTYDQLTQYLGVQQQILGQMPVIIYLSKDHKKYKLSFSGGSFSPQIVIRFLKSSIQGKQKVFYKSQSLSVTEKSQNKNVKALVGSNFDRIVRQSGKEYFALFYNRLDYTSRALKIQFQKTAESLRKNSNIIFCKVNMDKNEIASLEELTKANKTPFILFFRKDKKLEPKLFVKIKDYEASYDYMLKWLKETTEYPWVRSQDVSDKIQQEQL